MKRRRRKAHATRLVKALKTLTQTEDRIAGGKITANNVLRVMGHPEVKRAQRKYNQALRAR